MKIIFMGTPEISAYCLEALIAAGHEILLAVTQPDREKGRGKGLAMSPVKAAALAHGIPVFQPVKLREPENTAFLRRYPADLAVVVAFGQILPKEVLELPKYGCINVHASLLPLYRGAAPIQRVILDGCEKSGVTTMMMDEGLDTGDILLQREILLDKKETGGSLFEKMTRLGAELLCETLERLEAGTLVRIPQQGETCYAAMLKKEMGHLDWQQEAAVLERTVRGMDPWPGSFTFRGGRMLKILAAEVETQTAPADACPGTVLSADKESFLVQTGKDALRITAVQPEGKKPMDAGAYLRGAALRSGELLG